MQLKINHHLIACSHVPTCIWWVSSSVNQQVKRNKRKWQVPPCRPLTLRVGQLNVLILDRYVGIYCEFNIQKTTVVTISSQLTAAATITALWFGVAQQPGTSARGNESGSRSAQTQDYKSVASPRGSYPVIRQWKEWSPCIEGLTTTHSLPSSAISFTKYQLLLIVGHFYWRANFQKEAMFWCFAEHQILLLLSYLFSWCSYGMCFYELWGIT